MTKQSTPDAAGAKPGGNLPSHKIYAVTEAKRDGGKNFWAEIGAAWEHQDGRGFTLSLKLLPLTGQSLVMRVNAPRDKGGPAPDDDIPF